MEQQKSQTKLKRNCKTIAKRRTRNATLRQKIKERTMKVMQKLTKKKQETKEKIVFKKSPAEKLTLIQSMRESVYKEVEDSMDLFVNPSKMNATQQLDFYDKFCREVLVPSSNRKDPFAHKYQGRLKGEAKITKFVGLCFKRQRVLCERMKIMMTYVDLDEGVRQLFYSKKTLKSLFKVMAYNSKQLRESVIRLVLMIYDDCEKLRPYVWEQVQFELIEYNSGLRGLDGMVEIIATLVQVSQKYRQEKEEKFFNDVYTKIVMPLLKNMKVCFQAAFRNCVRFYLGAFPVNWSETITSLLKTWPQRSLDREKFYILHFKFLISIMPPKVLATHEKKVMAKLTRLWKSPQTLTAQRSLDMWKNKSFMLKMRPQESKWFPWLREHINNDTSVSPQLNNTYQAVYKILESGKDFKEFSIDIS